MTATQNDARAGADRRAPEIHDVPTVWPRPGPADTPNRTRLNIAGTNFDRIVNPPPWSAIDAGRVKQTSKLSSIILRNA